MIVRAKDLLFGPLIQTEHGEEGSVHAPLLFRGEMSSQISKPVDIDSTDLLDENSGRRPIDINLRSERCRLGPPRCWSHEDDRPGKKHIRLHDDTEALPLLFVTYPLGEPQGENVTPLHGGSP